MKVFQPKILTAFQNYKSRDYVADIVAGIIVAIIADADGANKLRIFQKHQETHGTVLRKDRAP